MHLSNCMSSVLDAWVAALFSKLRIWEASRPHERSWTVRATSTRDFPLCSTAACRALPSGPRSASAAALPPTRHLWHPKPPAAIPQMLRAMASELPRPQLLPRPAPEQAQPPPQLWQVTSPPPQLRGGGRGCGSTRPRRAPGRQRQAWPGRRGARCTSEPPPSSGTPSGSGAAQGHSIRSENLVLSFSISTRAI